MSLNKSDDTSSLEALITLIIGIPLSTLLTLYSVFTIVKLVEWFRVPIALTYPQWIGSLAIISIVRFKIDNKKSNSPLADMIASQITHAIGFSLILTVYYVLHFII